MIFVRFVWSVAIKFDTNACYKISNFNRKLVISKYCPNMRQICCLPNKCGVLTRIYDFCRILSINARFPLFCIKLYLGYSVLKDNRDVEWRRVASHVAWSSDSWVPVSILAFAPHYASLRGRYFFVN